MWIVKSMRWTIVLFVVALVAGCVSTRVDNYCELAAPIWWEDAGELADTPDTIVRQVVRHNERWRAMCG